MKDAPAIQLAGPAYPPVLAAIHGTAFSPGEAWSVAMFAAQLGLPGVFALIEAADGLIVARVAADEAEILTLAVAPQARGRGIARRLVHAAAARARANGAGRMFLEVSAANEAAQALYASCGFAPVGVRRRYYADGTDARVLAVALGDEKAGGDVPSPQTPRRF